MAFDFGKDFSRGQYNSKRFKRPYIKKLTAEKSSSSVAMLKQSRRKSDLEKINDLDINMLMRYRRETDLERLGRQCKDLEYGMNFSDALMGFFGTAAAVAGILLLPGLGLALSGVLFGAAVGKGILGSAAVSRDCADVPFKELELKLNKSLGEVNRKLDQQEQVLKNVTETVSLTLSKVELMRIEMDRGFERILDNIQGQKLNETISDINFAYKSFSTSEEIRRDVPKDEYVSFVEQEIETNLLLNSVKLDGKLYQALFSLINNPNIIPNGIDHTNAYNALSALSFGTMTYSNIILTLLDQYTYIAEYYYQEKDLTKFNKYLERVMFYFTTFKHANKELVKNVLEILKDVQTKYNIKDAKKDLYNNIVSETNKLETVKDDIEKMSLHVIADVPKNDIDIIFDTYTGAKESKTGLLDWERGATVSYALQYEEDGKYSRISKWVSEELFDIANPEIVIKSTNARNRIVFRKFDDNQPEVIRVVSGSQLKFRDIDRDLYDLALKKSYSDESIMKNMNKLLSLGANVSAVFESKRGVIHAAAIAGRENMLKRILEVNRNIINQKDSIGYTALHLALINNRDDFVQELVRLGADVNMKTGEQDVTPLHLAVRFQSERSVDSLLASDEIRPNEVEKSGKTPLHIAVSDNSLSTKIAEKLINSKKVDVNVQDSLGLTALHVAVSLNSVDNAFNLMARKGINKYARDNNGMSPIHYAAKFGYDSMFAGFIHYGIDAESLNYRATDKKWTPLHFAVYFKHDDLVDNMPLWIGIHDKISVDVADAEDQTPLHLAAQSGSKKAIDRLMLKGAKAWKKTAKNYSPLAIAILNRKEEAAKEIVWFEKDSRQELPYDKTPKDLDKEACILADFYWPSMFQYLVIQDRCDPITRFYRTALDDSNKPTQRILRNDIVRPEIEVGKFLEDNNSTNGAKFFINSHKINEDIEVDNLKTISSGDVDGALLLLDLVIRKFTKEKYISNWRFLNSPHEARASALEITRKLDRVLNEISAENKNLDSFDLYSNIRKAIQSGNESKFHDALCSYINEFHSLKPDEVKNVLKAVLSNEPKAVVSQHLIDKDLLSLVNTSCRIKNKFDQPISNSNLLF